MLILGPTIFPYSHQIRCLTPTTGVCGFGRAARPRRLHWKGQRGQQERSDRAGPHVPPSQAAREAQGVAWHRDHISVSSVTIRMYVRLVGDIYVVPSLESLDPTNIMSINKVYLTTVADCRYVKP